MANLRNFLPTVRLHALTLLCLAALSACHHSDTPSPDAPIGSFRSVAIVYVMAENSLSSYAPRDLDEMRRGAKSIPDSCLLAVYYDSSDGEKPQILLLDNQGEERILHTLQTDPVSTDSTTMQEVLNLIIQRCPARHYGLTLWSHGSGWVPQEPRQAMRKTIGIDNGNENTSDTGQEMEIETLANILENTGRRWEYVFFDACYMQGVEVAYELRHVTDWCIGSPAEIPADGAPYHVIMPHLFADSAQVWRIAEAYYDFYRYNDGLVISAVKTSELEALAAATAPLIARLNEYPTMGLQQYWLVSYLNQWRPEFFDMGSAMGCWLTDEEYQKWRAVAEKAVPYHYASGSWITSNRFFHAVITDAEHIICMSMYIPVSGRRTNEAFTQCSWYEVSGWSPA